MNLYRIIQEAVHNALKHANATHIEVRVVAGEAELEVAISDDGTGMPEQAERVGISRGGGNGLHTMRQRAQDLGGTLTLANRAGGGTVVQVVVPLLITEEIDA